MRPSVICRDRRIRQVDVGGIGWCSCGMGGAADLAGRVGELQAVSDLLSGASERAAMLIVGDAGVGKTRLVAAASEAVGRADTMVASGWCLPLSEGLPFLPMLDVLRTLNQVDAGRLLQNASVRMPTARSRRSAPAAPGTRAA